MIGNQVVSIMQAIKIVLVLLLLISGTARGSDIVGKARVIDGDTIELEGEKIRLHGIDAPEMRQTCLTRKERKQKCGELARQALSEMVRNQKVACKGKGRDRYKRLISVCFIGPFNLNEQMVLDGWALAYRRYSKDYIEAEKFAEARSEGIWKTEFIRPWEWRKGKRLDDRSGISPTSNKTGNGDEGCLIKGNISSSGKIYHVPGGSYYDRTKIDLSKGERWFCSEEDAVASGWRPSRR